MALIEVKAEITGAIENVLVGVGDKVYEDDTLVEMESMKMLVPIMAPEDGEIKEILVKKGDKVAAGAITVILEV